MANISAITLPNGNSYDIKDKNAVPVYGMGDNLLDNWYFVGGGSGRGVFPINQRGATSISTSSGYPYFIDRWYVYKGSSSTGYASLDSTGVYIYRTSGGSSYAYLAQLLPTSTYNSLSGKKCTISVLLSNEFLYSKTATITAGETKNFGSESVGSYSLNVYLANSGQLQIRSYADSSNVVSIKAVKLEIGTQQTLCHNEGTEANPVWVLNDVPNYENELSKCIIQPIEGSTSGVDTYANKNLATTQQLAPIETGLTASQNYTVGDLICWNNLLYKASSAIASGDTLAVGTNLTATTIEDEIEAVNTLADGKAPSTTGIYYGTCSTAAATAAKVATVHGTHTSPPINIRVRFTKGQGATSPTLNVNGTGAYPIRLYSTTTATTYDVPTNFWEENTVIDLEFSTLNQCWIVVGKSGLVSSYKINSSYTLSGSVGYYKLCTIPVSDADTRCTLTMMVDQHFSNEVSGIVEFSNRTSSDWRGVWLSKRTLASSSGYACKPEYIRYEYASSTLTIYVQKKQSAYPINFHILRYTSNSGLDKDLSTINWVGTLCDPADSSNSQAIFESKKATELSFEPPIAKTTMSFTTTWNSETTGYYQDFTQIGSSNIQTYRMSANTQIGFNPTAAQLYALIQDGVSALQAETTTIGGVLTVRVHVLGNAPGTNYQALTDKAIPISLTEVMPTT